MSDLPEALRREVLIEVYRQAAELDWDGMSPRERSIQYNRWINDPQVGGELSRYLDEVRIRHWLKDVAIKEYSRAKFGIGAYAPLVSLRVTGPDQIAKQVMGPEWSMLEATIRQKPNSCHIVNGDGRRLMMWGPPNTFRDLVWAGINVMADGIHPKPLVVVTSPQGEELDIGEKRRHVRLGAIAGLDVRHTSLRVTRVTPGV
jgi:hypothetical protein